MLTMDEYLALRRLIGLEKESEGARVVEEQPKKKRRSRTARANDKKMSKALAKANADLRKKNGDLKKGVTQGMIMSRAHMLRKKM